MPQHLRSTLGKPHLARPFSSTTAGLRTTTGFRTAAQEPLYATHESAHGTTSGGGDGVNEDHLAVFDTEVVGVGSARELGEHLDGADSFVNDVAADVGVSGAGSGAAGGRATFGLGGLADHQRAVELFWESTLIK
jgi:hypothetical protein